MIRKAVLGTVLAAYAVPLLPLCRTLLFTRLAVRLPDNPRRLIKPITLLPRSVSTN